MSGKETIILEEPGVRITDNQVVLGRHGYLTKDITGVSLEEVKPRPTVPFLLTSIGFLALAYFVFHSPLGILLMIIFLAPSLLMFVRPRPRYFLKVTTTDKESKPVQSLDRLEIQRLSDAVNLALLHGRDAHAISHHTDEAPASYTVEGLEGQFAPTVPENCHKCDFPISAESVEWHEGNLANCPRCHASVEVIWRKIPQITP